MIQGLALAGGGSAALVITSCGPGYPSCLFSADRVNRTPTINSNAALNLQHHLKKFL